MNAFLIPRQLATRRLSRNQAGVTRAKGAKGMRKLELWNGGIMDYAGAVLAPAFHYSNIPVFGFDYLVPSQPCSDRSMVTPSGPLNLTSTLPRFAISSVPG
jgi:hypothetical protein